jgi:hypothetical protein
MRITLENSKTKKKGLHVLKTSESLGILSLEYGYP